MWTLVTSGQRGVDGPQAAAPRKSAHLRRNAVGRVHQRGAFRDFAQMIDEDHAFASETLDDVLVMHDLVVDVERRAVEPSPSSRLSIAMFTPAQNPRGLAKMIVHAGRTCEDVSV